MKEFYRKLSIKDWDVFEHRRYEPPGPGELDPLHNRARAKWLEAEPYRKNFHTVTRARLRALRTISETSLVPEYRFFGDANSKLMILYLLMAHFYESRPTNFKKLKVSLPSISPRTVERIVAEGVESGSIWQGTWGETDGRTNWLAPTVAIIKAFEEDVLYYYLSLTKQEGYTTVSNVLESYKTFHKIRGEALPLDWGVSVAWKSKLSEKKNRISQEELMEDFLR